MIDAPMLRFGLRLGYVALAGVAFIAAMIVIGPITLALDGAGVVLKHGRLWIVRRRAGIPSRLARLFSELRSPPQ